jgi:hypothetical protein
MNHLQPAARTPPPSPVPPPVPHNHDGPPVDLHDGGNVCQKLWTVRSCVSLDIRTVRHRITEDISDTVVSRFDTSLSDEIDEYTLCLNLEPDENPQVGHRHWLNIVFDFQRGTVTDITSGINVLFFPFYFQHVQVVSTFACVRNVDRNGVVQTFDRITIHPPLN